MCGRFTLFLDAETLREEFGLTEVPPDLSPRYNIAPSMQLAVVTSAESRKVEWMRWGLVPSWAKDPAIGNKMINARSETLMEKPSFRNAFQRRRCLILADGFYEWKRGEGKNPSAPYYFHLVDQKPFAFAGLWEFWRSPEGEDLRTCTIITCAANSLVASVHDRMPVIFTRDTADQWLAAAPVEKLHPLLAPLDSTRMSAYPVSRAVNAPGYDSSELIRPLAE
jgi:putative SOS response-associated peptidase YedK